MTVQECVAAWALYDEQLHAWEIYANQLAEWIAEGAIGTPPLPPPFQIPTRPNCEKPEPEV